MVKEEGRRGWRRGAESGGGRGRGREGDERKDEVLAVDINDLEREPRQAIRSDESDSDVRRGFCECDGGFKGG